MRCLSALLAVGFIFLLSSCATKTTTSDYVTYSQQLAKNKSKQDTTKLITDYEKIPHFKNLKYTMAPGFLFYLHHPSDEKLKGRFRADFDGILRLPYNVRINVKGLTFNELKNKVLGSYAKYFQQGVENVDFRLLYKQYYLEVRGFVKKSGRFLVSRKEGIDKVVDKAGGLKGDLKTTFYKAFIKQEKKTYSVNLNQYFQNSYYSNAFRWTGGDSIFITEQDESEMGDEIPIVTVLGGVNRPGKILFKDQASLFYYLSKSGGTVPSLTYTESYVIRHTDSGISKIKFDLTDMGSLPAIYPNDVILLQAEKSTWVDKIFQRTWQISSILLTAWFIFGL